MTSMDVRGYLDCIRGTLARDSPPFRLQLHPNRKFGAPLDIHSADDIAGAGLGGVGSNPRRIDSGVTWRVLVG